MGAARPMSARRRIAPIPSITPMALASAAIALFAHGGCRETPAPYGEILVVVDTDVSVPRFVGRLRVDLFTEDGTWFDARDIGAPTVPDWPISFSVLEEDETHGRTLLMRLRAYPDAKVRDYHGERYVPAAAWSEPTTPSSLSELCNGAAKLELGKSLTLRRGAKPVTTVTATTAPDGTATCDRETLSGSAAARVEITKEGDYRFEIVASVPDGSKGEIGGDTTLSLRRACGDVQTQLACDDDVDAAHGNRLSRIVVHLAPGSYWLLTGGNDPAPADVTLRGDFVDQFVTTAGSTTPEPVGPELPRLVVSSVDVTPTFEPEPSVAIDRLVTLRLEPGVRRTASITLRGACLGVQSDLQGKKSCVDAAQPSSDAGFAPLADGIDRSAPARLGTWSGEQRVPCSGSPRAGGKSAAGTELFDEDVCIQGGALSLGDLLALQSGDLRSNPERVFVVKPFFLDRFELTVGRYREALARGFVPPDAGPIANEGPIATTPNGACTWSLGMQRDEMPLNCTSWATARALCQSLGGDLPTEAQWEFAATADGKSFESFYPWGNDKPGCDHAAIYRGEGATQCGMGLFGPVAVDAAPWATADVTPAKVSGLGGNLREWTRDAFVSYAHPLWRAAALDAPLAWQDTAPLRSTRGSDWLFGRTLFVAGSVRNAQSPIARLADLGFRCARPGAP